jgi:predicted small lipoprotein YifL
MTLESIRLAVSMLTVLIATAIIAGCGVRGPLEPPPAAQAAGAAKSPEAQDPGPNSAAPEKPHEPFVLDPLLR